MSLRFKVAVELLLDSGKSASSGVRGYDGYYLTAGVWRTPEPGSTIALWLFACFDKRKLFLLLFLGCRRLCAAALVYGLYYKSFVL